MRIFRYIFYSVLIISLSTVLIWFFAVPADFIRASIEEAVSEVESPVMVLSVDELRKGLFFSLHAGTVQLSVEGRPAVTVTDLFVRLNPLFLIKKQLVFSLKGSMGSGSVDGSFRLPGNGTMRIHKADLDSIPYLKILDNGIQGYLSSDILLDGRETKVLFEIPRISFQETHQAGLPLLSTFHRVEGVLTIADNAILVNSLGLEGEKGYARVNGDITGRIMNLNLELMPQTGSLSPAELMIIKSYEKSPGYYLIPITGPVP